jgi:Tfp pilus assembly protein PilZ
MSNQRYMAQVAATFLARSQSIALLTDYITPDGVFVRTDSPPQVMELLRIEFVLPPSGAKVVMHGMATQIVLPRVKNAAPGVEIAFFAKGGEAGMLWDQFITHLNEAHPESLSRPVMLAREATDQIRRAHPRLLPASPIQIIGGGASTLTIGDISDGGMFIKTNESFVVGSDLRITLHDPRTGAALPVDCIVRRRASGANAGIGVEFRNMKDEQRAILRTFMQAASPVEPVQAKCEVVLAPVAPRMMTTLPGMGLLG